MSDFADQDAEAVLRIQDDVPFGRSRTSQRQREQSRDHEHDESNRYR